MTTKKHQMPLYFGTSAERAAFTLTNDARGSAFFETDTGNVYLWDGSSWNIIGDNLVSLDGLTDVVITTPVNGYVLTYDSGSGNWIDSAPTGGSGGASAFIDLSDVPASYTGEANKYVRVAAAETGLEFVAGTAVGDLDDLTDVNAPSPNNNDVLTWDAGASEWIADAPTGGGGDAADITYTPTTATDWDSDTDPGNVDAALDQLAERIDDVEAAGVGSLDSLTDVSTPSPADEDILGYVGSVGLWQAVTLGSIFPTSLISVSYAVGTATAGADQNRNTAGSFNSLKGTVFIFKPIKLSQVLWDIRNTGDYTLTILDTTESTTLATVGPITVSSAPSADQAFTLSSLLYLWPGGYVFKLTKSSAATTWSDYNVSTYTVSLFQTGGVVYDSTAFSTYSLPIKLVAYTGDFALYSP